MKKNVGTLDRAIRVVSGILIASAGVTVQQWLLALVGFALIGTGIAGWCGVYTLFGMSTCSIDKNSLKKSTPKK
jgi:type IV secretory pathway TrbD component